MSNEQITQITGKIKQIPNAPFFVADTKDIDASDIVNTESLYPTTSLSAYLRNLSTRIDNMSGGMIAITEFKINNVVNNIVEVGTNIDVQLVWNTNREPSAISLKQTTNGETITLDVAVGQTSYIAKNITEKTSWTLQVFENGSASLSKTLTLYFNQSIYYGMIDFNISNVDDILGFQKYLVYGTSFDFTTNPVLNNETACILLPEGSVPTIAINGLKYEWSQLNNLSVLVNGTSYTYTAWRHPQIIQDNILINVNYTF